MQTALRCFAIQQKLSLTETRRDAAAVARTLRVMVVRVVVVVGIIVFVFTLPL